MKLLKSVPLLWATIVLLAIACGAPACPKPQSGDINPTVCQGQSQKLKKSLWFLTA